MMEHGQLPRRKVKNKVPSMVKRPSVGADIDHLEVDKTITTDPGEYSKRRTLKLTKKNNSWGFTLQSYGIKHKKTNEIEVMTYIDYVDIGGAAWIAGMQRGDVILSVNGERVGEVTHQQLVEKVRQAGESLRLVVLFEDCCKKVELHDRFLKLKAVLRSKFQELRELELQEMQMLDTYCQSKGLNRYDQIRQSILSSNSSGSDSWDAYSMISAPHNLQNTGHHDYSQWSSVSSLKSFAMEDNSGSFNEEYLNYIDSESDNSDGMSVNYGGMRKSRSSDSDLVIRNQGTMNLNWNINKFRLREKGSNASDSALYRRPSRLSEEGECVNDDVFEVDQDLDQNGLHSSKSGENFEEEFLINSEQNLHLPEPPNLYYPGENGNIIVPKICIEGEEIFTTFDNIDISENLPSDVPNIAIETYHDNIVAINLATEIARIENLVKKTRDSPNILENGIECPKIIKSVMKNDGKVVNGMKLKTGLQKSVSTTKKDTGAILKSPNSKQQYRSKSAQSSPRLPTHTSSTRSLNNSPRMTSKFTTQKHLCGSLSYDQLKSSIPDTMISFHSNACQIIYINDKNEVSKL